MQRKSQEQFIEECKKTHGGKYDYSKSIYTNIGTKTEVICKEHGSFYISPYSHISGSGCPKCAGQNLETEDVIKKSIKTHGDRYDYSLVKYTGVNNEIDILCKKRFSFIMFIILI
jgi:DUF1365 family protein